MALTRMLCAAAYLVSCLSVLALVTNAYAQEPAGAPKTPVFSVSRDILLRIIEAEDKRRWNNDLSGLLADQNPAVRRRAALAAGRIGDERAVPILVSLLQSDRDEDVRAMAAFALGETEIPAAGDALVAELARPNGLKVRARVVEALGKTTASLPQTDGARLQAARKAILSALESEASGRDTEVILFGLTAALRARPEGAGKVIAQFLTLSDPRIRAGAANALARLRAKDGNDQLRKLLTADPEPIVRANAARVLGATEDKDAFDGLLDRALKDTDSRVRVSAIRALASLRDSRAATALLDRGQQLRARQETNELLEIATALGRIEQNSQSQTMTWLKQLRDLSAPEVEIALARIGPQLHSVDLEPSSGITDWRQLAARGQGVAELANVKTGNPLLDADIKAHTIRIVTMRLLCPPLEISRARSAVRPTPDMVIGQRCTPLPIKAVPDWLRAFAAFKTPDSAETLRKNLEVKDVIVRATAAELLGELPPDEANSLALTKALPAALQDKELNDAALAILDSLAKQKTVAANDSIKKALDSSDHLIRRRAATLLKANGAGDFSARIGTVQTRNTEADYERALSRIGKNVRASVITSRGPFTIELLPEEAPLNVDSFIQLSRRGYFKGITFHRVVPNFVIQGGDPRGDGNGGPGYSIRCEINQLPYERGAVGMALSGKDTGGSQWFVTHSPQPHLDGGYTVFGRVIAGMDVVDRITRGDVIRSVVVTEGRGRASER